MCHGVVFLMPPVTDSAKMFDTYTIRPALEPMPYRKTNRNKMKKNAFKKNPVTELLMGRLKERMGLCIRFGDEFIVDFVTYISIIERYLYPHVNLEEP